METSILQQALYPMVETIISDLENTIIAMIPIIVPVFTWLVAIGFTVFFITRLIKSAADNRERLLFMQSDYYIDHQDDFDF